jgi:hypothetical protein
LAALSVSVFTSPQLGLVLSSLEKNAVPLAPHKPIFSPSQLQLLFRAISLLPLAPPYSMAFSLAFLAMLRISNLAPLNSSSFDPHRHPRPGDLSISSGRLVFFLRWIKTLQRYNQTAHIPLFSIPGSPLCPLQAFTLLQRSFLVRSSFSLIVLLAVLCSLLKVTFAGLSSSLWVLTLL